MSLDTPTMSKLEATYKKAYPKGVPQAAVVTGWTEAEVMKNVLEKACENKDLSREGIVKAFRQISSLDTDGLVAGDQDFSQVGKPSTKQVYVSKINKDATGGQEVVGEPYTSPNAESYEGPSASS